MTTIQPRQTVVTIYQGDYLSRIRHLEARYDAAVKAEKQTTATLDEVPESPALAAEHAALVAEADETALHVTLQALGRRVWRALVAEHPPRKDNAKDLLVGANEETLADALVPMSIVEPALTPDDLDALSDADYDRLYTNAFALNRAPATDPKALRGSQENPGSGATSN